MNWIKNNKNFFGWLILFFLFLIPMVNLNFCGDDIGYGKTNISTIEMFAKYLYKSYLTWETRLICRFIETILAHTSIWVWRCCYAGMYILFIYSLKKIFDLNKKNLLFVILLVMIFPMNTMNNAGWVATTCNYFFPCVCGIYFFSVLQKNYLHKQIGFWEYFFSFVCLIYAADHEQTVFCILLLLGIVIFLQYKQHCISRYSLTSTIISCLMLSKIILSPALKARYISEITSWYPDYGMLGVIDKIHLGFVSTFSFFYYKHIMLWILLCTLVAIGVWKKHDDLIPRIISIIPVFSFFMYLFNASIYRFENVGSIIGFPVAGMLSPVGILNGYTYLAIFNYLLSFLGILIGLYLIFESDKYGWIVPIGFLIAFSSRMIMSFSPTLFASSTRTFCSFLFGIMMLIIVTAQKIDFSFSGFMKKSLYQIGLCFGVILWINMLITK